MSMEVQWLILLLIFDYVDIICLFYYFFFGLVWLEKIEGFWKHKTMGSYIFPSQPLMINIVFFFSFQVSKYKIEYILCISLNMMSSSSIQCASNDRISFFFIVECSHTSMHTYTHVHTHTCAHIHTHYSFVWWWTPWLIPYFCCCLQCCHNKYEWAEKFLVQNQFTSF